MTDGNHRDFYRHEKPDPEPEENNDWKVILLIIVVFCLVQGIHFLETGKFIR